MIKFKINDQQVQAQPGWTVLETARQHGINIPTLCYHEAVEPSGACRLCVVELREGDWSKVVISCMYPVAEGLNVYTDSQRVKNVRRWILEMLLAECPASKEIQALAAEYGVGSTRFAVHNPEEQCILCGLCSRVCAQVVGANAISTVGRGVHKQIGAPYMIPTDKCVACGCCVTVCPTGAMRSRFDAVRGVPKVVLAHGAR
ncbi:MAG: 4Fe-4S dicluster domain-containing protein [Desulfarculus sp.]|jgi:NADH dehydrogenase/NADH:ubiquinone oxidoreductase subunit G|nr:MAG: 4Fe-4S dicluster domain-containing protein [Desulfarculus sp.]